MKRTYHKRASIFPFIFGVFLIIGGGAAAHFFAGNTDALDAFIAAVDGRAQPAAAQTSRHAPQIVEADPVVHSAAPADVANTTDTDAADSETASTDSATLPTTSETDEAAPTSVEAAAPPALPITVSADAASAQRDSATNNSLNTAVDPAVDAASNETSEALTPPETMIVLAGARARACPETACSVVFTVRSGLMVTVRERVTGQAVYGSNDQWLEVEFEGQAGYIYSDLLAAVD